MVGVSKLFRAYGLYNVSKDEVSASMGMIVSKLFRAYGLYNTGIVDIRDRSTDGFKALSSLRVI